MFRKFLSLVALVAALAYAAPAQADVIGGASWSKVVYLTSTNLSPTPSANNSGRDYGSPKPLSDGDLLDIPANVVITNVYGIVDQAGASLTAFNLGDDDDPDGYVASASPNASAGQGLESAGLKYWDIAYKGVYLKDSTVVANHVAAKYYSATGKKLKLDVTGTSTNYKMRVFVHGYVVGRSGL